MTACIWPVEGEEMNNNVMVWRYMTHVSCIFYRFDENVKDPREKL